MTQDRLPYWPAALNAKMAAAYCGLSIGTFLKVCPLKPIGFTGSSRGNRYLRQRIDEWLLSIDPNEDTQAISVTPPVRQSRLSGSVAHVSEQELGPGGYPIQDDKSAPLYKFYSDIGFDARTMNSDDMDRLMQASRAKWRDALPGQKLWKLEESVLRQLLAFGEGVEISSDRINCGASTEERLELRGFIKTCKSVKFPDRTRGYILTAAGCEAAKGLV